MKINKEDRALLASVVALPLQARAELVADAHDAHDVLERLRCPDVRAIAMDILAGCARLVVEGQAAPLPDIRTISPWCVVVVAWTAPTGHPAGDVLHAWSFDLTAPGMPAVLDALVQLPVTLVVHDAKPLLYACWTLGIEPAPRSLYDTRVVAACLRLGLDDWAKDRHGVLNERLQAARMRVETATAELSLAALCLEAGLGAIRGEPLTGEHDRYLPAPTSPGPRNRAVATAVHRLDRIIRLFLLQQAAVEREHLANHLVNVELPFVVVNARMQWHGVSVDPDALASLRARRRDVLAGLHAALEAHGVPRGCNDTQFTACLVRAGIIAPAARTGGETTLAVDELKELEDLHPAIRLYRRLDHFKRLVAFASQWDRYRAADGRIHPDFVQLGAATGRTTTRSPGLTSLKREFRPLVVPGAGNVLIELDYAQFEPCVVAALTGDRTLEAAIASGDLYTFLAQRVFASSLPVDARAMTPSRFKVEHAADRDKAKTLFLAMLYNMKPDGVALRLQVSRAEATRLVATFSRTFGVALSCLQAEAEQGVTRGYAAVFTGLRRRLLTTRVPRWQALNRAWNTPIQGAAAVLFKLALIELDRAFRGTDVKLIINAHDAVVIECPAELAVQVEAQATALMEAAVRRVFPGIPVRVERASPDGTCWNKGRADSLKRFLEDPVGGLVADNSSRQP